MDKIILADDTAYEIKEGASLGNIQIKSKNFDGIKTITDAFAENNLAEVTFKHNNEVSGKYTDLKCDGFTYAPNTDADGKEDGTYTVTIRLRTKTDIEKRLDALEAGQASLQEGHESNAGAIEELADMVAGSEV
nr:MAG TPA: periplasmic protein [Caudoviricetes sp.]